VEGIEVKRCLIKIGIRVGAVSRRRYFPIQLIHDSCGETMDLIVKLEREGRRLKAESLGACCAKCGNVPVPLEVLQEPTLPLATARRLAQIRKMEQDGARASKALETNERLFNTRVDEIFGQAASV
jgi:hypothetical protein